MVHQVFFSPLSELGSFRAFAVSLLLFWQSTLVIFYSICASVHNVQHGLKEEGESIENQIKTKLVFILVVSSLG